MSAGGWTDDDMFPEMSIIGADTALHGDTGASYPIEARIEHMSSIHVFSGPRSKIHEALNFVKSNIIARRSDLKTNKITLRHVRINLNFKMVRGNI